MDPEPQFPEPKPEELSVPPPASLAGLLLRLPGPAHLVQLVMDTSGFEAQTLQSKEGTLCSIVKSQDA